MNSRFRRTLRGFCLLLISAALISTSLISTSRHSGLSFQSAAWADTPARKIITGWLPYYGMKTALPDVMVNSDLMQEVNPFWYTVKDQNTISDLYTSANPSIPMAQETATIQALNLQIVPTITDGTGKGVLAGIIAKDESRANLVKAILALVMDNHFDGIDLDFEGFAFSDGSASWPTTQPNWVRFISDLSAALHGSNKTLSVTTPVLFDPATGKKGYYVYAWSQIGTYIDHLRIMAYDYSVSTPGPIGPITWSESALQYAVSVMPSTKVFLAIPGYGRDWITAVSGTCPADLAATITTKAAAATFVMRNAASLAATYGATPTYQPKFGESTFTYKKIYTGVIKGQATSCTATRTAWYQDPQAWLLRANLVTKYNLAGIALWTLGMEDPAAITAIRSVPVVATLSSNAASTTYGSPLTLTAQFTRADKSPLVGIPGRIEEKGATGDWHTIFSGSTDANGALIAQLILGRSTSLRAISDQSASLMSSASPELPVTIQRLISWSAPASIRRGKSYLITGFIQPRAPGVTLVLEGGGVATTDNAGNFALPISRTSPGLLTVRIDIEGDAQFAPSASDPFTILVR